MEMNIIIYQKDLSQRAKNEQAKTFETYKKQYIKNNSQHGQCFCGECTGCETNFISIYSEVYKFMEHRICLKYNDRKCWIRAGLGYQSIERIANEQYQLIEYDSNITSKIFYLDETWYKPTNFGVSKILELDKIRETLLYFETMIYYVKIGYLIQYLPKDIITHIRSNITFCSMYKFYLR